VLLGDLSSGVIVVEHPTGTFDVAIDIDVSGQCPPFTDPASSVPLEAVRRHVFPREY